MNTQVCKECGRELSIIEFRVGKSHGTSFISKVCKECSRKKSVETRKRKHDELLKKCDEEVAQARLSRLEEYSPRELMNRLAELGYKGKLTYTVTTEVEIDITNF